VVPRAGHGLFHDRPELATRIVAEFLAEDGG
jgi:hypothetical protein